MMQRPFIIVRRRAGFALIELPLVIAMLGVVAGASLCFAGHCGVGSIIAVVAMTPLALLLVPPLFRKGR